MQIYMESLLPIKSLTAAYTAAGASLYAVGGAVRNALLGLPAADVDLTGALPQETVLDLCRDAGLHAAVLSTALGTIQVRAGGQVYEYTPFRSETYAPGGAHRPAEVQFGASMAEDAARRDFTANALYCDCETGEVRDPLGGLPDVNARRLRMCAPGTLESDALRILRLVRLAAELGFSAESDTLAAARANAALLIDIAPERRRAELERILLADARYENAAGGAAPETTACAAETNETAAVGTWNSKNGLGPETARAATGARPATDEKTPTQAAGGAAAVLFALELLETLGAWEFLIPALTAGRGMAQRPDHHRYTVLNHAFHVCAETPPVLTLRLAGLLHDVGKPACLMETGKFYRHAEYGMRIAQTALADLRFSNEVRDTVVSLVGGHMYDIQGTAKESTLRLRFAAWGRETTAAMILLREADIRGCGTLETYHAARWRVLYETMLGDGTPFSEAELNIGGREIMTVTGLPPGTAVGAVKSALLRRCILRPKDNTREKLLQLAAAFARDGARGR